MFLKLEQILRSLGRHTVVYAKKLEYNEVITSAPIITDGVILSDIIDDADDDLEKDEEDKDIPPPSRPSNREIEESLDKLRDLSLFSTHGDEIQSLTLKLEALLDKERLQNLQQRPVLTIL